jgi:exodeoxyribonuclease V gamma subunit
MRAEEAWAERFSDYQKEDRADNIKNGGRGNILMGPIRLHTSNRLEILADALAEVLKRPLRCALDKEVIVVQSKGMERWICLQIAERQGICANCRFPFPNALIHEIFQTVLGHVPEKSPFDPEVMTWRIMKCLPSLIERPGFADLRAYFGDYPQELKLFQLSERIADTFDQYLLFRREMIESWEGGHEMHWQAMLWRELLRDAGTNHRAALAKAFFETVRTLRGEIKGLPERVSVFGISALPPFYMEVLSAISKWVEVNLFIVNPCQEYWGTIVSAGEMEKRTRERRGGAAVREELHLEKGNTLLASMGTLGRDFLENIYDFEYEERAAFEDPGESAMLTTIQHDILNLIDRQEKGVEKKDVDLDDQSIQVHVCHSPMREVEVLRDQLLWMFEKDSSLLPKDILVMMPDIETYAPYIHAVFDLPEEEPTKIPFTIADRSIKKESGIGEALLSLLDLHGSRFGVSQVLNLLEVNAVQRRFGLVEEDMDLIRTWVRETNIRWGIDAQSKAEMGLPAFSQNTWRAGLERLLLGYALPGQDERMFQGILPYDRVEGEESRVLGAFSEFLEKLFHHVGSLSRPRTLRDWQKVLFEMLEAFFLSDEEGEKEAQAIRGIIQDLARAQEAADFHGTLGVQVIKSAMNAKLDMKGFGFGFLAGSVTFCAMLPMRSIPFRVICLLGMNSDAYPRQSKSIGFDLMSQHPRKGDRSRRNDDRYLFLEAILSAREKLCISYVGQSHQDNKPIPPSVLVSELMDYLEQGFEVTRGNILEHLLHRHRLQAFSPQYFRNHTTLRSFSEENYQAASALLQNRSEPSPFISAGLSEPEETWQKVELEDLCSFYLNPSKFLLNRRLGIYLEETTAIPEERESFDLFGLERYLLEKSLLRRRLQGMDPADELEVVKASGRLPSGVPGECLFEAMRAGVQRFVENLSPLIQIPAPEPLEFDLEVRGFRLSGKMEGITAQGLVRYRYASIKPKDHLRAWIYHLALNSLRGTGSPRSTVLAGLSEGKGKDREWVAYEYGLLEEAEEVLLNLLRIYWNGLTKPVPFFPKSSWSYAEAVHKGKSSPEALGNALRVWESTEHVPGEDKDPYYQLCFRHKKSHDSDFEETSLNVFGPLLKCLEKR